MSAHDKAIEAAIKANYSDRADDPFVMIENCIEDYLDAMAEAGWKLTPKQPTPEMYRVGESVWEWMWDAAPRPEDVG